MQFPETKRRILKWLQDNEKSQAWLARETGTFPQRLCDYLKGRRTLSPEVADRIEVLTGGAITMREVLGLPSRSASR